MRRDLCISKSHYSLDSQESQSNEITRFYWSVVKSHRGAKWYWISKLIFRRLRDVQIFIDISYLCWLYRQWKYDGRGDPCFQTGTGCRWFPERSHAVAEIRRCCSVLSRRTTISRASSGTLSSQSLSSGQILWYKMEVVLI